MGPYTVQLLVCFSHNLCVLYLLHTQHKWLIEGQYIVFQKSSMAAGKEVKEASLTLINNALVYAKELERIV